MVVVHRALGFRFVIYTPDHAPAHVHIIGAGQAKVNLVGADGRPGLVSVAGIRPSEMRRLMKEIEEQRDALMARWERIHGRTD